MPVLENYDSSNKICVCFLVFLNKFIQVNLILGHISFLLEKRTLRLKAQKAVIILHINNKGIKLIVCNDFLVFVDAFHGSHLICRDIN